MAKRFKGVQHMDRSLAEKIKKYVSDHPGFIQTDTMAMALQEQYGEYRRRPRIPFRILVKKLYDGLQTSAVESSTLAAADGVHDDDLNAMVQDDASVADTASDAPEDTPVASEEIPAGEVDSAEGRKPKRRRLKRRHPDDELDSVASVSFQAQESRVAWDDFLGYSKLKESIVKKSRSLIHYSLKNTTQSGSDQQQKDINFRSGFLLHGPSGCGKTFLAHAIAGGLSCPILAITASEIVSGVTGDSESKLRQLFQTAREQAPCVLLIDRLDCIGGKAESASKQMEARLVAQLASCCDDLFSAASASSVLLIGTVLESDKLDNALQQAGRFGYDFCVDMPDENSRYCMLQSMCSTTTLDPDVDLKWLAHNTPGFTFTDLQTLFIDVCDHAIVRCREATCGEAPYTMSDLSQLFADRRLPEDQLRATATMDDFKVVVDHYHTAPPLLNLMVHSTNKKQQNAILPSIVPCFKKDGFAHVPDVSWSDVGSLDHVKKTLNDNILTRVRLPQMYKDLRMSTSCGVLLVGPPGCGKTMLAKAIASESSLNFISVKGPELFNMYVGETERGVRKVFARARSASPCIIFFDEIDSMASNRSSSAESTSSSRIVNMLLTEMDGAGDRGQVFVMAATNRPEILDPALLRPGRFDTIEYVGIPDAIARRDILCAQTRYGTSPAVAGDVDLQSVADDPRCEGFSGADLKQLVTLACKEAIAEQGMHVASLIGQEGGMQPAVTVDTMSKVLEMRHFEAAMKQTRPSVSEKDRHQYEMVVERMQRDIRLRG